MREIRFSTDLFIRAYAQDKDKFLYFYSVQILADKITLKHKLKLCFVHQSIFTFWIASYDEAARVQM